MNRTVRIIKNYESLTEPQKEQFKRIVMEGLKGKFAKELQDDTDNMQTIINTGIKYDFLPISKCFCAVDSKTGDVQAILILNDFLKPSLKNVILIVINVIRYIGVKKAIRIASGLIALDNMNKESNPKNIKAEIYLVSTSESHRGKGIGKVLIQYVLDYLHTEFHNELSEEECKVKLLVVEGNPAVDLYKRLGFKQVSSVATPKIAKAFGRSYSVMIRMEKEL
jgi:GNAT superfamily N-acetyltransferase